MSPCCSRVLTAHPKTQVVNALESPMSSVGDVHSCCSTYWLYGQDTALSGLDAALRQRSSTKAAFFESTLPAIVKRALRLPQLVPSGGLPVLRQRKTSSVTLVRPVGRASQLGSLL